MLKKILFFAVLLGLFSSISMANVLDFLPANTSMFIYFENNEANYTKLKEVPLFDFALQSMGIEFMISLNLNQLATSQNIKDPAKVWDILKGDVVLFSTSSPEEELKNLESEAPTSPKEVSPDELLKNLQSMNFCVVIQPKGNSKEALETLKKLLSAMEVNLDELGVKLLEYSGYILLSNSNDLISQAEKAYSGQNKFADNPEVSKDLVKLLSKDSWIKIFAKSTDPEKLLKDLSKSDVEIPVKYGNYLGWAYFEDKKLVGNGHVDYEITDESLKLKQPIADVEELESKFSFPGQIFIFANLADAMKRIDYIFDKISEVVKSQDMSESDEEDFDTTMVIVKNLITKFDGKISAGVKVGQSATATNFVAEAGLSKVDDELKMFLKELSEKTIDYNGKTLYILGEEEGIEFKAFVEGNKLFVTSLNPDELNSVLNQGEVVKSNSLYNELSQNEKGAQLRIFADLGQILAEFLGMPVNSGLLIDTFVGENSIDNRLIIK
ncbi:MAG TPA: hypothetical protein ENF81_04000 [Thermotogaceae bacterium]|nr:hypothetical protein [Thermotogaceae bacterium]